MKRFSARLTALVPDGWLARESIQLTSPQLHTYAAASVDAVPPETTTEEYAGQYEEQLRAQLPAYEELRSDTIELPGGRSAVVRKVRWTPPEGEPITELQMFVVHHGRGVASMARAPKESFDRLEPQLRELLAGIGFGPTIPTGGVVRWEDSPINRTYEAFEAGELTTNASDAFGLAAPDDAPEAAPADGEAWAIARTSWEHAREGYGR